MGTYMLLTICLYIIIGAISGLAGALLGIGGGVIIVPALLIIFSFLDFPKDIIMQLAIGTSLSSMVINTFAAAYFHNKKKNVVWEAVGRIFLGIVIGSFAGAFMARELSSHFLEAIFGVFACLLGLSFIKPLKTTTEPHKIPSFFAFTLIGVVVACLSNLLGLGGGFFMLPIFFYFQFEGKKAIGTSSATSFLISLGGSIGYLISTKDTVSMPGCFGYIYIPAFLSMSLSSLITSFYGVKLAQNININVIRKIFAVVIITVGLTMIFN